MEHSAWLKKMRAKYGVDFGDAIRDVEDFTADELAEAQAALEWALVNALAVSELTEEELEQLEADGMPSSCGSSSRRSLDDSVSIPSST
ncbi:MAG: hypothetical protein R3C18_21210 [Planctomycetaceae bacterium]